MSKPRVTIAVNNYNYERFLPTAIDSALAQTHGNVEIVVVDDGSLDGSQSVIAAYGDRVVPVLKENGGQGSAFNAAFGAGTGDVFLFLDADDALDPDAAAAVATVFEEHPDTASVMFRLRIVDEEGRPTGRERPRRAGVMPDGDLQDHVVRFRCYHWQPTSGTAYAAAALARVVPVPEADYRISADAYLAATIPLCGPVRSIDAVLGSYRVHRSSHYSTGPVDAAYFRRQVSRIITTHAHVVRLAPSLDVDVPADPHAARDAALLGFRMSSLVLDPGGHPFPGDSRIALARRGITAALRNRQLALPNRLRRAAWFTACAVAPRRLARVAVERFAADTPAARIGLAGSAHAVPAEGQ